MFKVTDYAALNNNLNKIFSESYVLISLKFHMEYLLDEKILM